MNNVKKYDGKNVLVMGFGLSGINAAHLLVKLGANVVANDKKHLMILQLSKILKTMALR